MKDSLQRVRAVLRGEKPDRTPIYELLRNDAVISHFAGEKLDFQNAREVVFRAFAPAVDATRPSVRLPERERTGVRPNGRQLRQFRWTVWHEHAHYADSDAYAAAKRKELDAFDPAWTKEKARDMEDFLASVADHRRRLGEVFFFPSGRGVGLMGAYGEVGLEDFSYYLADCPEIIDEVLERQTVESVSWIEHLPEGHGIEAVFAGDDIAFKSGPLLAPAWFKKHYFARLARVTAAYHRKGIKVLFHSDGNLYPILDGLVEAGIDGLNPIEVLAGMDVAEIHRRHPHLFLAGGIDVSQLLPFGKPQEVKDAVHRAIEGAGGRLMVGSSTELHEDVPLENFLALREAAIEHGL
ncbi:MAG: uroporphyrinogen decarboxylase family protein [Verrucomicrobiia bacterium]